MVTLLRCSIAPCSKAHCLSISISPVKTLPLLKFDCYTDGPFLSIVVRASIRATIWQNPNSSSCHTYREYQVSVRKTIVRPRPHTSNHKVRHISDIASSPAPKPWTTPSRGSRTRNLHCTTNHTHSTPPHCAQTISYSCSCNYAKPKNPLVQRLVAVHASLTHPLSLKRNPTHPQARSGVLPHTSRLT